MRSTGLAFCLLALLGCETRESNPAGDPEPPTITGTSVTVEPEEEVDPTSPARFYRRVDGNPPLEARCPDVAGACVNEHEFEVYVTSPEWDHHYVLPYADDGSAIRDGATNDMQWMQRLEQGVRHALAQEEATEAHGRCGLAAMMPVLFGAPRGFYRVPVPPQQDDTTAEAVTPAEANGILQATYTRVGFAEGATRRFFDDATMARMTGDTLNQPIVTRRGALVTTGDTVQEALLFVLFSAESQRTYVLDRTSEHPVEEEDLVIRQRQVDNQAAVLRWLSAIGETEVGFTADAACEIPEPIGGRIWRELATPWER